MPGMRMQLVPCLMRQGGRKIKLKRTKMDILEEFDNIEKDEVEREDLKKENNVPTI